MTYTTTIIRNEQQWSHYISQSAIHEVYHTWHYHSLNTDGEPVLFVYKESEDLFIALPVIKRSIKNSTFFDMTSVYGYAGPVSNQDFSALSNETIAQFKMAFLDFMHHEKAVSIFSRLHPFMDQCRLLANIGGIKSNGKTIYMDLTRPVEEQYSRYDKRLLRQIRSLRRSSFRIKETRKQADVQKFAEMYRKNMDRLNASAGYYFDEAYFTALINAKDSENKLILIYDHSRPICGALILLSDNIIRNHLSATDEDYLKESPSKLLTDEISNIGRKLGKRIFHLGGGVGGKEDSLFQFKRHFSDLLAEDNIWCFISNQDAYDDLVMQTRGSVNAQSNYFPSYRY